MAEFWDVASGPAGSAAAGIALEMETRRAGSSRLRTAGSPADDEEEIPATATPHRPGNRPPIQCAPINTARSLRLRGHASGGYRTENTKASTHLPAQGNGAKQCSI